MEKTKSLLSNTSEWAGLRTSSKPEKTAPVRYALEKVSFVSSIVLEAIAASLAFGRTILILAPCEQCSSPLCAIWFCPLAISYILSNCTRSP